MTSKGKNTDFGVLKISNDVIASIARIAALEVPGVTAIKTGRWTFINDFLNRGSQYKGVRLEIYNNEIKIAVTVIVRYGVNIPEAAAAVQNNIRTAVEDMTGLFVSEVNVNIGDLAQEKNQLL